MTTIAWDGATLAADSQETEGGVIATLACKKIYAIGHEIVAPAGISNDVQEFVRLYPDDLEEFSPKEYFEVVILRGDGLYEAFAESESPLSTPTKVRYPYAWGTGAPWAIAALDHGKDAKEAVEYAATRDIFTGGPVQHYSLDADAV